MSRTISQAAKTALFNSHTDECFICLLTIEHSSLSSTIRINNSGEDLTSRGNTYSWYPFEIVLPADSADEIPAITIKIADPERQIAPQLRALTTSPTITLEIVTDSDNDTVEAGPFEMSLKNLNFDILYVIGTLSYEDVLDEPYPSDIFSPTEYPGLF